MLPFSERCVLRSAAAGILHIALLILRAVFRLAVLGIVGPLFILRVVLRGVCAVFGRRICILLIFQSAHLLTAPSIASFLTCIRRMQNFHFYFKKAAN